MYFHLSFNAVKIQNAFGLLDQNKDGALDLKEFSKVGIPGKSDTAPCPRIITDLRQPVVSGHWSDPPGNRFFGIIL